MVRLRRTMRGLVVTAALCGLLAVSAAATEGTVTDSLRLRSAGNTDGTILTTLSAGTTLEVTGAAIDGWYPVTYASYTGYVAAEYVTLSEDDTVYGQVSTTGGTLNLRSGAGTTFDKISSLANGTIVTVLGLENDWYQISYNGTTGYVTSEYFTIVDAATAAAASTVSSFSAIGDQVVAKALTYLGTPYVYGSSGPSSFDCSGFTSYVYSALGYSINRTSSNQTTNGVAISKSDLQPGDLVFFATSSSGSVSHVGIYIGDGQFIHASTSGYQVRIDDLSSGYYSGRYVCARRIV